MWVRGFHVSAHARRRWRERWNDYQLVEEIGQAEPLSRRGLRELRRNGTAIVENRRYLITPCAAVLVVKHRVIVTVLAYGKRRKWRFRKQENG